MVKIHVAKTIRTLLLPILAASGLMFAATGAMAPVAHATSSAYECPGKGSCAKTTGPEAEIENNIAENQSGTGVCSAIWWYFDGWLEDYYCTPKPTEEKRTIVCSTEELYGHGESRRYYAKYEYKLWGWETNIWEECY